MSGKRKERLRKLDPIGGRLLARLNEHTLRPPVDQYDSPSQCVETGIYGEGIDRANWRRTSVQFKARSRGITLWSFEDWENLGRAEAATSYSALFEGNERQLAAYAYRVLRRYGLPNLKQPKYAWQQPDGRLIFSRNKADLPPEIWPKCNTFMSLYIEHCGDIERLFLEQNPDKFEAIYASRYLWTFDDIRVVEDYENPGNKTDQLIDRHMQKILDTADIIKRSQLIWEFKSAISKVVNDEADRGRDIGRNFEGALATIRRDWQFAILHDRVIRHETKRTTAICFHAKNEERASATKEWHQQVLNWAKENRPNDTHLGKVSEACIKALNLQLETRTVADFLGRIRPKWQSVAVDKQDSKLTQKFPSDEVHGDRKGMT